MEDVRRKPEKLQLFLKAQKAKEKAKEKEKAKAKKRLLTQLTRARRRWVLCCRIIRIASLHAAEHSGAAAHCLHRRAGAGRGDTRDRRGRKPAQAHVELHTKPFSQRYSREGLVLLAKVEADELAKAQRKAGKQAGGGNIFAQMIQEGDL